jgi:ABC-type multidrug transport system ATPase subunit
MIICENLTKLFDSNSGIKNINLQFYPGIIYGIIGYNGAGKTTLLRCIEGLYAPNSGAVYHNGVKTTDEKAFLSCRRRIAFLPAEEYLYKKLTCLENIELATILRTGQNKLLDDTRKLITYFEAEDFLEKRFMDCSTGMKKKIQLIVSLIGDIDTIIWDEPNDGLDLISNIKLKNLLTSYKNKQITILFSCHVIEFLDNFIDYCITLNSGTITESREASQIDSLEAQYIRQIDKDSLASPL